MATTMKKNTNRKGNKIKVLQTLIEHDAEEFNTLKITDVFTEE